MLMNKILLMMTCISHISALSEQDVKKAESHMMTLFKSKTRHVATVKKIIIRTETNYAVFKLMSNSKDKALLQKNVSKALKVLAEKNEYQKTHAVKEQTHYANTFIRSSLFSLLGDISALLATHTKKDIVHIDTAEDVQELDYMNVVLDEKDYVRYELDGLSKTSIIDEVCENGVLTITITDHCVVNPIRVQITAPDNTEIKIEANMIAKVLCDNGKFALDISGDQIFLDIYADSLLKLNVHARKILEGFVMNYSAYSVTLHALHYHLGIHGKAELLGVLNDALNAYSVRNYLHPENTVYKTTNAIYNIQSRINDLHNGKGQCLYLDAMLMDKIAITNKDQVLHIEVL